MLNADQRSARRLLRDGDGNEVIEVMPGRLRARFSRSDVLTERPDFALVGILRVPQLHSSPGQAITRRIGYALAALAAVVLIVYLDRDGYRDVQENPLSLLDCVYYATVSLSTTGYGDITPITAQARLVNILVVTPAADLLPHRPGRHHPRRADRDLPPKLQDSAVAAPHPPSHRRRRVRHQGPRRRQRDAR